MGKSRYVLGSGRAEAERLRAQARSWDEQVEALLDEVGVRPGWSCLDLGCGARGHLGSLSRRAGPTGKVVGLDKDAALVAAARAFVREEGLSNVEVLERDMYSSGLQPGSFDLTHTRYVFAPITGDRRLLLDIMVSLTRPGGVVVVEEPDLISWSCAPRHPSWDLLMEAMKTAFEQEGSDLFFGRRAFSVLRAAGLGDVKVRAAALALQDGDPYMEALLQFVGFARVRILRDGLLQEAELDAAVEDCRRHLADPDTFVVMPLLMQVWGEKPTG
jgi:SAM-dependent methyltransferase